MELTGKEVQTMSKKRQSENKPMKLKIVKSNLDATTLAVIEHWKEFRPTMYRSLKEAGTLEKEALRAVDRTMDELYQMTSRGVPYHQAWEMLKERYMYLPEEEGLEDEDDEELPVAEGYNLIVQAMNLLHRAHEEIEERRNLRESRKSENTQNTSKQPRQLTLKDRLTTP